MVAVQMVKPRPRVLISKAVPRPHPAKIPSLAAVKISFIQLMDPTKKGAVLPLNLDVALITSCQHR